ncbi:MAG: hypothetical protein ACTSV7_12045 [Candidatus Baldrarchaeia archaeon]
MIVNVLVLSFGDQFSRLKLPPNTYIVGKKGVLEVTHLSGSKENLVIKFYVVRDKNSLARFLSSNLAKKIDMLLAYYGEDVLESLNTIKKIFSSIKILIIGKEDLDLADVTAGDVKILDSGLSFQEIVENINQILETMVEVPSVFSVTQLREEISILKNFISKLDNELRRRTITVKEYFEEKKKLEERINVLERKLKTIIGER